MTQKPVPNKNDLTLETQAISDKNKRITNAALSANFLNASLAEPFYNSIYKDVSMVHIANGIKQQIAEVKAGDMASMEALLVAQANSLQIMFVSLGRMATQNTQLDQYTAYMNLALKAQSQSRATVQALVELKFPKQSTFVKQANIANGHQQINNNPSIVEKEALKPHQPRVEKIENQTNELLTDLNKRRKSYAQVDNRRTKTPSQID